jgi:flagellar biosynthesis protein FlhB
MKYLIPIFISPIFLVLGYFSFLNFQRGIPFFEPFNFLAKIKLLLLSLLVVYIFVLIYELIFVFFSRKHLPQKLKISKNEILS